MRHCSKAVFTTRQTNNRLEHQLQSRKEDVTAGQRIKWKNINSLRSDALNVRCSSMKDEFKI